MDPYSIEYMDTFSNILFVKEERGRLSFLAHKAAQINMVCVCVCVCVCVSFNARWKYVMALEWLCFKL